MTKKEELQQQFEEAFDDTEKKEEAARALTTQADAALVVWGDRESVIATGIRIKTMLPGGDKLTIPHALAAGQYAVATGLNPFRGEFYAYTDKKGNLSIVDGYKALTRWAEDECPYDAQYHTLEPEEGEHVRVKCIVMRHDRRAQLDYYLEKGADFQTAFDLVTTSKIGVVKVGETRWQDGNPKDPPHGWSWEQVAEKRALKNTLNFSHGMPTVAELARKSWEVAGILTKPEDWEGTEDLRTQEERERLAELSARTRETVQTFEAMTPEEQAAKLEQNRTLLYGEGEDDPFGEVIDAEPVEYEDEDDNTFGQSEPKEELMTLGQALGIAMTAPAPKLGLKAGDYLLEAVKLEAKDLIEYLTKASSYQHPTHENLQLQQAARVILDNWDRAREAVQKGGQGEPVEEIQAVQGDTPPLF